MRNRYGPAQSRVWDAVRGDVTSESFARYLRDEGIEVDPSLCRHWHGGETHMPVGALVLLARHHGDPLRVLAPIADLCGVRVVPADVVEATGRDVMGEALDVASATGALVGTVRAALADGRVSAEEREALLRAADDAQRELDELRAVVRAVAGAAPVRAVRRAR